LHVNRTYAGGASPAVSGTTDPTVAARFQYGAVAVDTGILNSGTSFIQVRNTGSLATNYNLLLNPNGGNVGIGTTTPTQKLHVAGAAQLDAVSFGVSPGSGQTLALATVGYVNASLINGTGPWARTAPYTYPSTLTDNVGIGTTTPGAKLETYVSAGIVRNRVTSGSHYIDLFANSGNSQTGLITGSTFKIFTDGGTTPAITALTSGNVGIGTINPATKLQVSGSGGSQILRVLTTDATNATAGSSIDLALGNDNWGSGMRAYVAPGQLYDWQNLEFYTSSFTGGARAGRMTLQYNGNVGIGTTTPTQKLHVAGGAQLDAVSFGVSPGSGQTLALATVGYVNASLTDGTGPWRRTAPYTYPSTLTDNVGVGVTNPANKLDVSGNVGINGILKSYGSGNNNFFEGKVGISTVSAGASSLAVFGNASIGTGYLSNAAPANGLIVEGNVGIGITNPAEVLHLVGNLKVDGGAVLSGNLNMASSTLIVNKITANTIDPLYTIKGIKYSTYAASIVGGVNEEYVGRINAGEFKKIVYELIFCSPHISFHVIHNSSQFRHQIFYSEIISFIGAFLSSHRANFLK
jgi:hypothetical protein